MIPLEYSELGATDLHRQKSLKSFFSHVRLSCGLFPVERDRPLLKLAQVRGDVFDGLVGLVPQRTAMVIVGMRDLEFVTVARKRCTPVDHKPIGDDSVVIDHLVGSQCMQNSGFQCPAWVIFALQRRGQVIEVGAVVFNVKRECLLLHTVVDTPFLAPLGHGLAAGVFRVGAGQVSEMLLVFTRHCDAP